MSLTSEWNLIEPDLDTALQQYDRPLEELAVGNIPAIVLRKAWPQEECQSLVEKLIDDDYLYDPHLPIPEKFQKETVPEGYFREGKNAFPSLAWEEQKVSGKSRIDIGTSLGYRGSDREAYFQHSAETIATFERLFEGRNNPIHLLYRRLEQLSVDKITRIAYEPNGQMYGPAIIRAHYGGYTYKPHFDSVRLREKREEYAVHQFAHQFAGVLVLQNTTIGDKTAQSILHRCLWKPEVDPALKSGSFHEYAAEQGIENVEVHLEPGDLYFFNTRAIHEVPGLAGELPRIVLATFIGYDSDRDEIFVWA